MNQKQTGIISLVIAVLLVVLMLFVKAREDYYINLVIDENNDSCFLPDGTCLHEDRNFFVYIFGSILSVGLIILGVYLIFVNKVKADNKKVSKEEYKEKTEKLEPEEKQVFERIIDAQGTIFQSELVEKTGHTKVKITRILDRLEGKGLIERKRRGMTNVVILKNQG